MSIIELVLALQVNDFTVPERVELDNAVTKALECQQVTHYSDQCASVIEKWLHKKSS